jgi:branched-chain amino acid transport system permease protein
LVPELLRRVETSLSLGGHPLYGLSQIIVSLTIALVIIYRRQGMMGGQEIRLPKPFRS